MKHVSQIDWSRLAMAIDGEGAILLNRHNVKKRNAWSIWLRVTVVNTDPRLPQWCADTFAIGKVVLAARRRKKTHKMSFRWQTSCRQAEWIIRGCRPYFIIKGEEADIALAFQATLGRNGQAVSKETRERRQELREALHLRKRITPLYNSTPEEFRPPRKRGPKPKNAHLDNPSPKMSEIVQ